MDESSFYIDGGSMMVKYVDDDDDDKIKLGRISRIDNSKIISRATAKEVLNYRSGKPLSMTEFVNEREPIRSVSSSKWGYSTVSGIIEFENLKAHALWKERQREFVVSQQLSA